MTKPKASRKPIKKKSERAVEMPPKDTIILPPKYYHENFCHLLAFVERLYGNILEDRELSFISRFRSLPEDGQCLWLRMANRRGKLFWQHKLQYEELDITENIWQNIFDTSLGSPFNENDTEAYEEAIALLTKQELVEMSIELELDTAWIKKARKPDIVRGLVASLPIEEFVSYIRGYQPIVRQQESEVFGFLLFLYFGNRYLDMSQFVMRDLGNIRLEDFGEHDFTPYFQNRKEADDKWLLSEYSQLFYQRREDTAPEELATYFQMHLPKPEELAGTAHNSLDRLLLKIGTWLEKQKMPRQAMEFYQKTQRPPAKERQIRLLLKQKRKDEALNLCRYLLENYQNASEKYFALDMIRKEELEQRLKSTTVYLKKAPKITLSAEEHQYQVEQGVLEWYEEQGYQGIHAENWIWRALFGLVLWDTLYEAGTDSIHNPFQRIPSDLYQPDFYSKRKESVQRQLDLLEDSQKAMGYLTTLIEEKWGIFNPFVAWHEALLPLVSLYVHYMSGQQLKAVLLEMAQNVRENCAGFPDLFIYKEGAYRFVEVKSPNDSLSSQQLHWLELFEEHGIHSQVMRVEWG